jgi:hypothetical protein
MWMCGVRPRYHPGKIVRDSAFPFAFDFWCPRRKRDEAPFTAE